MADPAVGGFSVREDYMRRYPNIVFLSIMMAGSALLAAGTPSEPNLEVTPVSAQSFPRFQGSKLRFPLTKVSCASEYETCAEKAGEHCHSEVSDLPDKKRAAAYVRCVTQYQGACRDMHCSGKAAE